ncbi:hypothetical protein V8G54_016698 [Vigna mungo]|uniref:Uncharacterized protein n=1 Tax=Vigna mungo TaxID=3915 RepID=A0AAQ3S0P4_VIGMU
MDVELFQLHRFVNQPSVHANLSSSFADLASKNNYKNFFANSFNKFRQPSNSSRQPPWNNKLTNRFSSSTTFRQIAGSYLISHTLLMFQPILHNYLLPKMQICVYLVLH